MPQSIVKSQAYCAPARLFAGCLLLVLIGCSDRSGPQEPGGTSGAQKEAPTISAEAARPAFSAQKTREPGRSGTAKVSIDNFTFNPETLEIPAGTKVVWVNGDDVPHTVRSTENLFRSGALDTDDEFEHLFSEPGTYEYYCGVHAHMTGKVIVK